MSTWKPISADEAQSHPLFGIGGWLLFFTVSLVFSFLSIWEAVRATAQDAEMSMGELLTSEHPLARFLQIEAALSTLIFVCIAGLLFTKASSFRQATSVLLLAQYPLLVLNASINHVGRLIGPVIAIPALAGFIGTCIWVVYLHRSKRVRVTFEHMVRTDTDATPPSRSLHPPATTPAPAHPINAALQAKPASTAMAAPDPASVDDEAMWELALAEVEGSQRRNGLWAKCYAQSGGNESAAKASYLDTRVQEMTQQRLRDAQQLEYEQEALKQEKAKQAWEKSLKGVCPNCENLVLIEATECHHCKAMFGVGSVWQPRLILPPPHPDQDNSSSEILLEDRQSSK